MLYTEHSLLGRSKVYTSRPSSSRKGQSKGLETFAARNIVIGAQTLTDQPLISVEDKNVVEEMNEFNWHLSPDQQEELTSLSAPDPHSWLSQFHANCLNAGGYKSLMHIERLLLLGSKALARLYSGYSRHQFPLSHLQPRG